MSYTLVIVESPNKTRKIEGFLGAGYKCVASFGHFRDLPESGGLGIEFNQGRVIPHYEVLADGKRAISTIAKLVKEANKVILATDPDREGEAISWHLAQELRIPRGVSCVRATFQEITKPAVQKAIANTRQIDINLVNAQQSRRMLDRCVGWIVSDTMRTVMKDAKSAGRVQSVAVRLVVEREREILAFKPITYFVVDAVLERSPQKPKFTARLVSYEGKVIGQTWTDKTTAEAAAARCKRASYQVAMVDRNEAAKAPPAPFTTSTMQMAASVTLRMSPKRCMEALQRLFEAGHITYHRTDSPNLSAEATEGARAWIASNLPKEYLPAKPRTFKAKGNAQEAHEAIRPTHWETGPNAVQGDDAALYQLIWTRFIACQCADGKDIRTTVTINAFDKNAGEPFGLFQVKGVFPLFDGWRRIANLAEDEKPDQQEKPDTLDENVVLPPMEADDWLSLLDVLTKGCTTKPPARFTEAKLIATLEKLGIGRPSTYAAIMETIVRREYIRIDKAKLYATELGMRTVDYLVTHFTGDFIDVSYTSQVEASLDRIAAGELDWQQFTTTCATSLVNRAKQAGCPGDPLAYTAPEDAPICPQCQKKRMIRRNGSRGPFWGCSGYPKCKGILNIEADPAQAGEALPPVRTAPPPAPPDPNAPACPKCSKPMKKRHGKQGDFWGCQTYPACNGTKPL